MPADLAKLRQRLQEEKDHLAWFLKSGQRMDTSGTDNSASYLAGVEERIVALEKQISTLERQGSHKED